MSKTALVGIVMGWHSDWRVMRVPAETLRNFDIPYDARVLSAHRTPDAALEYNYFTLASLGSLLTLTALETVLGIDNVIFLSILVAKLPKEQQPLARRLGLMGALGMRIGLLFTRSWLAGLTKPFFTLPVVDRPISGRDLVLIVGGAFLVFKSAGEIREGFHPHAEEHHASVSPAKAAFGVILRQIVVMDIVFSLDSVITAVGLGPPVPVMITAMILSMIIMLWFAGPIGDFVDAHPTIKILALSFLILVGVTLMVEGFDVHVPKGYIYFAMAFSVAVEMINIRIRARHTPPVKPHHRYSDEVLKEDG